MIWLYYDNNTETRSICTSLLSCISEFIPQLSISGVSLKKNLVMINAMDELWLVNETRFMS